MEIYIRKAEDIKQLSRMFRGGVTVNRTMPVPAGMEQKAKELEKAGIVEIRYFEKNGK